MESIQKFFVNLWERLSAWAKANPLRAGLWAGAIILFLIGLFIPVGTPHVALSGEVLFTDGPRWLTNSVVTTVVVDVVIILLAVLATARMKLIPTGMQNAMEAVIEALYNLSESVAGERARQFFPWVATIFIFVLISNWSGLIPGVGSIGYWHDYPYAEDGGEHAWQLSDKLALANGQLIRLEEPVAQAATPEAEEEHGEEVPGSEIAPEGEHEMEIDGAEDEHHAVLVPLFRAPSADLNMTFALAIATMVMVQVWGIRAQGGAYFSKFTNTSGPNIGMRLIAGFVSFLEIVSEFSRVLAFGFRLFGNIFAGEVVLATMAFLIPFLLPVPFYVLEIFVSLIQALVFMMLALVFFTMATIAHGHDDHGDHGHGHDDHALSEAQIDAPPVV